MRILLFLILVASLSACGATSKTVELNADDRFDLIPFNMKPIIIADVKKCAKIMRLTKGYKTDGSELVQKTFDLSRDFWAHVGSKFSAGSNLSDVITKNVVLMDGNQENVSSIFPEKSNLEKNAELCGEYAGRAIVGVGLLSLSDTIKMVEESQPGFFEKLGYNLEDLLVGVTTINEQAGYLDDVQINDMISCVAVYQALKFKDVKFEPYSNIWLTALVRAIETGKVSAHEFGDDSPYWVALTTTGPASINSIDGSAEFIQQCENWLNEAIVQQEASNQ